jgi:hypothetical protein
MSQLLSNILNDLQPTKSVLSGDCWVPYTLHSWYSSVEEGKMTVFDENEDSAPEEEGHY